MKQAEKNNISIFDKKYILENLRGWVAKMTEVTVRSFFRAELIFVFNFNFEVSAKQASTYLLYANEFEFGKLRLTVKLEKALIGLK